jgi:O-acetyl-ADP-ribose deacetylase (regulator of RNase III)
MIVIVLCIFAKNSKAQKNNISDYYDFSMKGKLLAISLIKTENRLSYLKMNMAPLGSSVLTSSGNLASTGIKGILHAASGSMTKQGDLFKPSLKSVEISLMNSLILAKKKGFSSVAIPFIGGGIFLNSIGVEKLELAKTILKTSLKNMGKLKISIVAFGDMDYKIFKQAQIKISSSIKIINGSITKFSDHKSELIINAANTELIFGGGLSGHIGSKTERISQINSDCKLLINKIKSK